MVRRRLDETLGWTARACPLQNRLRSEKRGSVGENECAVRQRCLQNGFESQYRQGGKVSGQNVNGVIEAKVESDTITALLTVRTRGNRQTFVMDSPGAWVSHVSIDLVRDSR